MQGLNSKGTLYRQFSVLYNAKPFLKWAGGKTQLLDELYKRLPFSLIQSGKIERYVEPKT